MKILVTGGAGYIGSHTVEELIKAGHEPVVLDNLSTGNRRLLHPETKFIEASIQQTELIHQLLKSEKIEGIIHFAAFTSVAESVKNPEKFFSNNFGGTLNLLEAIKGTGVKNFIFSSTAAVYSDPGNEAVTEDSKVDPLTAYGKSKWMSEQALIDVAKTLNIKYAILRYFNVAGASPNGKLGQFGDHHTVIIKRAALAAVGKIPELSVFGTDYPTKDGTAERDFIHVSDLAELHVIALKALESKPSFLLNCGYGHGFSVKEVIRTMEKVSGKRIKQIEGPRRPGDVARVITNNRKLLDMFQWSPRFDDLELICRTAYAWEESCLRAAK